MNITIHRSLTDDNSQEILIDGYRFSYLMTDADEAKEAVFTTIIELLKHENGCFFSISDDSNKIAYGIFSYGHDNSKVRRLYYFAIEREFRGKGLGKLALDLAMETEVGSNGCCTLACKPMLRGFYEKLGFIYHSVAEDNKDEIIMAYFNSGLLNIGTCVGKKVNIVKILPEAFDIFKYAENLMKKNGIKPPL